MKILITIMAAILVALPGYSSQVKLPVPSFSKEWNKPDHDSSQLRKLLDEGNITQFYYISNRVIDNIYKKREEPKSIEAIKDHLLVRWLIATTPFIDLASGENVMWISDKGNPDSDAKSRIIKRMALETLTDITPTQEKEFNISKEEAVDIYFSTYALILKQFRDQIDPDFESKEKKAFEFGMNTPEIINDERETTIYFNRLNLREGRNSRSKSLVEEMEKSLMNLLLKAYPTKAMMVKKYLAMAGYSPKEMPSLLDRTIGRVPAAHYLYKSLPKRKEYPRDDASNST